MVISFASVLERATKVCFLLAREDVVSMGLSHPEKPIVGDVTFDPVVFGLVSVSYNFGIMGSSIIRIVLVFQVVQSYINLLLQT